MKKLGEIDQDDADIDRIIMAYNLAATDFHLSVIQSGSEESR